MFGCRSSWLLFYGIEAFAIYKVLKEYPDDADKAVRTAPLLGMAPCWPSPSLLLYFQCCPSYHWRTPNFSTLDHTILRVRKLQA